MMKIKTILNSKVSLQHFTRTILDSLVFPGSPRNLRFENHITKLTIPNCASRKVEDIGEFTKMLSNIQRRAKPSRYEQYLFARNTHVGCAWVFQTLHERNLQPYVSLSRYFEFAKKTYFTTYIIIFMVCSTQTSKEGDRKIWKLHMIKKGKIFHWRRERTSISFV